jgi:uncharacterized protein (UPF0261 family)
MKMGREGKNIVIVGTMDTKSEESIYLAELIRRRGHNPLLMDVGTGGTVSIKPDFTREEVALATGRTLGEILKNASDYTDALLTMAKGAKSIIEDPQRKIDGVLTIGGSTGTSQALVIMKDLPLRIAKLALSTVALIAEIIGTDAVAIDQTMMRTVADLWGLNRITRLALQRAGGAICGMVEEQTEVEGGKRAVAISALGTTTYVDRCKSMLEEKGYEPIVFHSVGTGAFEKLVRQGYITGTLDLSCYELLNLVAGGSVRGGEDKFTAATEKGIPQVISLSGLDFFPWPLTLPLPDHLVDRTKVRHGGLIYLIKTSPEEKVETAVRMAERINKATAPVTVLVPLRGFSSVDRSKEMPFYDPGAGLRFAAVLKEKVSNPLVVIEEMDVHINDPEFAERATSLLLKAMG